MYLDEIVAAQKRGEAKGIPSICSAHPSVLKETLKTFERPLIEATCNQVNQYGGYTGMTPKDFVEYLRDIAAENTIPFENIVLGGDHLGPNAWQEEPAKSAMQKSQVMIRDYVNAGFTKIHLDCSMKLGDDPAGDLDVYVTASRTAQLARIAEDHSNQNLRYVIGTEVPIPGGATSHEEGVNVTSVEDVRNTIDLTRQAFYQEGVESAWERVIAVVVQPGVEFGDDFVLPYQPDASRELSHWIEAQPFLYEAHSTDYQAREALKNLVRDHFAILKVGPALTFAFREAIFSLAMIEDELFAPDQCSNIIQVLEDGMLKHPEYWKKYYQGNAEQQTFKRKFSLSDRVRYYWVQPEVRQALERLRRNLEGKQIPRALLSQYAPYAMDVPSGVDEMISARISNVLNDYASACRLG